MFKKTGLLGIMVFLSSFAYANLKKDVSRSNLYSYRLDIDLEQLAKDEDELKIKRNLIEMTNIASIDYDFSSNKLEIGFKDKSLYKYTNVPESIYRGFMSARSKELYYQTYIRVNYPYNKLR